MSREAAAAIALMALATLATRLLGPEIMRVIGDSARARRFVEALSLSVLAAIVAAALSRGGAREAAAVAAACLAMWLTRSAALAMVAGMALAAAWTALE